MPGPVLSAVVLRSIAPAPQATGSGPALAVPAGISAGGTALPTVTTGGPLVAAIRPGAGPAERALLDFLRQELW